MTTFLQEEGSRKGSSTRLVMTTVIFTVLAVFVIATFWQLTIPEIPNSVLAFVYSVLGLKGIDKGITAVSKFRASDSAAPDQ